MTEKVCVYSATPPDEKTIKRIEKLFLRKHGGNAVFEYSTDPSLIGGLLIVDGNDYYDSTIAGRLAKIKRDLQ